MKKLFFIFAFSAIIGMTNVQAQKHSGLIGAGVCSLLNAVKNNDQIQKQAEALVLKNHPELRHPMALPVSPTVVQPIKPAPPVKPVSLPQIQIFRQQSPLMSTLPNRERTNSRRVLDQSLNYVKTESQSIEDPNS